MCAPCPAAFFGNMYAAPMVVLPALKPLLKQLNRVYPDPTGRPVCKPYSALNPYMPQPCSTGTLDASWDAAAKGCCRYWPCSHGEVSDRGSFAVSQGDDCLGMVCNMCRCARRASS